MQDTKYFLFISIQAINECNIIIDIVKKIYPETFKKSFKNTIFAMNDNIPVAQGGNEVYAIFMLKKS